MHKYGVDRESLILAVRVLRWIGLRRKPRNPTDRSWKAIRGREFEFDRFRHDDGRPRPFLRIE